MKWVIYILLLVNLGLFVWHYQPATGSRHKLSGEQPPRLVLLNEDEKQPRSASDDNGAQRCFSLGPFTRKASFNAAKQAFTKQGIDISGRVSREAVRNGYWVMLPISESRNQARAQIQRLKESGVKDYFLVAAGEKKNAISLGVFSKPKLAKRRRDEVEKLGFSPKISKIALPKRVYWLEWPRLSDQQPDKKLLDELRQRFNGIGQTERKCMGHGSG